MSKKKRRKGFDGRPKPLDYIMGVLFLVVCLLAWSDLVVWIESWLK